MTFLDAFLLFTLRVAGVLLAALFWMVLWGAGLRVVETWKRGRYFKRLLASERADRENVFAEDGVIEDAQLLLDARLRAEARRVADAAFRSVYNADTGEATESGALQ